MEHIKINDLSVGDWVMYEGNHRKVALIDGVNGLVKFSLSPNFVGTGAIEPIPITPEILEKNGFVENGDRWYNADAYMELEQYKDGWDRTINCGEYSVYFIKHVHQLQNAMRLAGIDKEIEL
jgi:hypothetical protein